MNKDMEKPVVYVKLSKDGGYAVPGICIAQYDTEDGYWGYTVIEASGDEENDRAFLEEEATDIVESKWGFDMDDVELEIWMAAEIKCQGIDYDDVANVLGAAFSAYHGVEYPVQEFDNDELVEGTRIFVDYAGERQICLTVDGPWDVYEVNVTDADRKMLADLFDL